MHILFQGYVKSRCINYYQAPGRTGDVKRSSKNGFDIQQLILKVFQMQVRYMCDSTYVAVNKICRSNQSAL
jgi:hypothetical protein